MPFLRTAIAALTCTALLACAGCGGVGAALTPETAGLTTMGFGLPDEHATARVAAYRAAHPETPVRIVEGAFDAQQFLSSVAAGRPPDLVYADRTTLGGFIARGALQPLEDCVRRHRVDLGQFRSAALGQLTYQGRLYGLPEFNLVRVLLVGEDTVRAAGVAPERVSTTDWGALAELTDRLSEVDGNRLRRIGFDPKVPEFLPLWAKANGADLVSQDGRTPQLDDPRVVEAVAFTADLVRRQGGWPVFKALRDSFDTHGARNEFATGQEAARPMENWYINTLANNSPKAAVSVRPFTDRRGNPISYASGSAWGIPVGVRDPAKACEFAVTMTAADTWFAAAKARKEALARKGRPYSGTYTANRAADERIFAELYSAASVPLVDAGVRVVLGLQDKAFALPVVPAGLEFTHAYEGAAHRVLTGAQDPASAMRQAQREAELAIERARR
ncbi:ABC transporter substrate-binding protein [Crossiella sp. NPDC003009]